MNCLILQPPLSSTVGRSISICFTNALGVEHELEAALCSIRAQAHDASSSGQAAPDATAGNHLDGQSGETTPSRSEKQLVEAGRALLEHLKEASGMSNVAVCWLSAEHPSCWVFRQRAALPEGYLARAFAEVQVYPGRLRVVLWCTRSSCTTHDESSLR
jgi:hypothetical protein